MHVFNELRGRKVETEAVYNSDVRRYAWGSWWPPLLHCRFVNFLRGHHWQVTMTIRNIGTTEVYAEVFKVCMRLHVNTILFQNKSNRFFLFLFFLWLRCIAFPAHPSDSRIAIWISQLYISKFTCHSTTAAAPLTAGVALEDPWHCFHSK